MINNSVIIASNAGFLIEPLREKLRDNDLRVFVACNDDDLTAKIKAAFPRFIFIENCFHEFGTDEFIQNITRSYRGLHIVTWTACEIKPSAAARFIHAGAESFFSFRDTVNNVETILNRIVMGKHYRPNDVEAVLDRDFAFQDIGKDFTKTEIKIINLLRLGKSYLEISEILSVSKNAIKFHKKNIHRKLGSESPVEILINAAKRGIIPSDILN